MILKMAWGIGLTLTRARKSLKNCGLIGYFFPNGIMFLLEKFKGIMCHATKG